MPSFRKEIRTLASRAVDELKKEVKAHFQDLPPWEDYDPDIIERYEEKLQKKERRQRQRAQISDPDLHGHTSGTTQHRDRRHAKEHRHRQRRHQINEHYDRSSTGKHKAEREHRHGVPRVVQPEQGAARGERSTAAPPAYSNYQVVEGEMVPCHDHNNSHRSSPKITEPRAEPRHEHRNSHRVNGQPIKPNHGIDRADEFRALIGTPSLSPSSVYSSYSDDEQGTIVADQDLANQPATQETSMLSGQDQYLHQPISQREDGIWEDDLDDWESEEEKMPAADQKRQGISDQQARREKWRNEVWPGNPEPCSDPSFVTEPRAQSTLERIGNIRLPNMSTASVTTRFSEFC